MEKENQVEKQQVELDATQDFVSILLNIRNGAAAMAICEELTLLATACRETQKKGSLTIKLSLVPVVDTRRGEVAEMGVSVDVSSSVPKHPAGDGIFFLDKLGRMSRNSPEQAALFGEG